MYYEMILNIQEGNKEELLKLIECFQPLLKKYAYLLGHQDAYYDLQLFFIEALLKMPLNSLYNKHDGTIVEYIKVTIENLYKAELKKIIKRKWELPLSSISEEQRYKINIQSSYYDDTFLLECELKKILSSEEIEILYLIYVKGFTSSDIALIQHKSRQAINQKKRRALYKLRESISKDL